MRDTIKRIDKKECIFSLILGVFCSLGLFLSMTAEVTKENSPGLLMDHESMVFVRTLYYSMSSDRLRTLLAAAAIAAVIYFARRAVKAAGLRISGKAGLWCCAFIFAAAQLVAVSYKSVASWDLIFETPVNWARALWRGIAYMVLFYHFVILLKEIAAQLLTQEGKGTVRPSWRLFFVLAGAMFVCWLPYLIMFYPGTSNEDTIIQMMEFYQIPSYIQDMSPMENGFTYMTNHHPYLLTLLFAGFFELGLALGDIRIGVAVYSVLHMCFLASVFSGSLMYLCQKGVGKKRIIAIEILLMALPIFPLYAICMVKDTIYSAFCLIFILMMYEVASTKGEALRSKTFDLAMFAVALLMILTKVFALQILVLVGIFYLFFYRRYIVRVLAAVFLPVILYQFVFLGVILPANNVAPGGKQEALSVPFQQTARYVCEYGDEVTEEERKAIEAILPYDELKELYNPELSDEVKKQFNQEASADDLAAYFRVWFQMFLKHPDVYVESLLNNTYQYYDINKMSNLEYYRFDEFLQENDENKEHTDLYVEHSERFEDSRYIMNQIVLALQKIPFINIFVSLGMLPWIMLFFLIYNIWNRRWKEMALLIVPFLTIAVCIVSPDNGNSRYVMPMFYLLPYLFALELLPREEETDLERPDARKNILPGS